MIEFLFWEGCPSHERALSLLRAAMDEQAIAPEELEIREIFTEEDAERERFIGSPTIRIDGEDVADPGEQPYGLDCRLYYHRDGRPSPLPDNDDLKEALASHARKGQ
ncbi:MAG: hypothetical protein QM648_00560 [Solirubrobacterales bacterium]